MADRSKIEWTQASWNALVGCTIVSPGCTHCYAMRMAARQEAMGTRHYYGTTRKVKKRAVWTGMVNVAPDDTLLKPLRWKRPRMIFVNSMSDLFHEAVPWRVIDRVFQVMELAEKHTFQVLTKRAQVMREYLRNSRRAQSARVWPLPNVWIGVSAERQKEADERIPDLLATPAAVRFLSAEPLLGPIDLTRIRHQLAGVSFKIDNSLCAADSLNKGREQVRLDWVICGGESGPRARPMHPQWARDLRDQCVTAGVPFFFKQNGEFAPTLTTDFADGIVAAWPDGIIASGSGKYHGGDGEILRRLGKKVAGRMLDGRTWDEMPARASTA
jgi:protein gp37